MSVSYPGSLSLKELLENPSLLQAPTYEGSADEKLGVKYTGPAGYGDSTGMAAYLGPTNLWGYKSGGNISLDCIDLDDLMLENEVLLEPVSDNSVSSPEHSKKQSSPELWQSLPATPEEKAQLKPTLPVKQSSEYSIDSTDLALASVPGEEGFDPSTQVFSPSELKPQPLIRKSRKVLVPDSCKDDKYWSRRCKNNVAAKRSREARRIKENQITLRAAFLEQENVEMKLQLEDSLAQNKKLEARIAALERTAAQLTRQEPCSSPLGSASQHLDRTVPPNTYFSY